MVYVDNIFEWPNKKGNWCHMFADTRKELHLMAEALRVKRSWFHLGSSLKIPHYDLNEDQRLQAIELGSIPMSTKEILKTFMNTK